MPTTNPRINVTLEKPVYDSVKRLAKKEGVSLSLMLRDLVKEALDIGEDKGLTSIAEEREKTFKKSKALTHDEVW